MYKRWQIVAEWKPGDSWGRQRFAYENRTDADKKIAQLRGQCLYISLWEVIKGAWRKRLSVFN